MGDTYWGSGQGYGDTKTTNKNHRGSRERIKPQWANNGLQDKSLCLIPQRFAIEMVNRGWILRNVIIWHKPNPMPSSAKDRFTVDFEYIFFFVKSNKASYYINPRKMRSSWTQKYDYIWIHQNTGLEVDYQPFSDRLCKGKKRLWNRRNLWEGRDYWFEPQYEAYNYDGRKQTEMRAGKDNKWQGIRQQGQTPQSFHRGAVERWPCPLGRNKRTVWKLTKKDWIQICEKLWDDAALDYEAHKGGRALWTIPTQPYPEAHFATFPEKLVEPMIKAGCPEFVCTKCGKARVKLYDTEKIHHRKPHYKSKTASGQEYNGRFYDSMYENQHYFKGYTDCGCKAGWRPGIVLDPFRRLWYDVTGSRKTAA